MDTGMFLPIRFYDDLNHTSQYRSECLDFDHEEYTRSYVNVIPMFEVIGSVSKVELLQCDETTVELTLSTYEVTVEVDDEFVTYTIHETETISEEIITGAHMLRLTTSSGYLYSDPIMFVGTAEDMIHLSYRGKGGIMGDIYWADDDNFMADMYISSAIEKPSYPVLEEVREDGAMNQHKVFQRWEKRHQITVKGVESMADALSLLPLMDRVYINDTRVYDVRVDVSWDDEYSCLGDIVVSYTTKAVLKTY